MFSYEELAKAASRNDQVTAEDGGFEGAVSALGVDLQAMIAAAEQRAVRAVLAKYGVPPEVIEIILSGTEPRAAVATLPEKGAKLMALVTAVWIDGFACAMRAVQDHELEVV
jgi:hypothetical protein